MAEDRTQTEQKQRPAGLKTEKKQTGQNLREIRVGFVGNPNCGKTTLFNAFTGANLKVANWPGVTVERVEGHTSYKGRSHQGDRPSGHLQPDFLYHRGNRDKALH